MNVYFEHNMAETMTCRSTFQNGHFQSPSRRKHMHYTSRLCRYQKHIYIAMLCFDITSSYSGIDICLPTVCLYDNLTAFQSFASLEKSYNIYNITQQMPKLCSLSTVYRPRQLNMLFFDINSCLGKEDQRLIEKIHYH